MKFNWNFQSGGGSQKKNPFHGGGMGICWNYTIDITRTGLEEKSLMKLSNMIAAVSHANKR